MQGNICKNDASLYQKAGRNASSKNPKKTKKSNQPNINRKTESESRKKTKNKFYPLPKRKILKYPTIRKTNEHI